MIKRTRKEVEVVDAHRHCDFCDSRAEQQYESNTCSICKRDVCRKHKKESLSNDSFSDYTDYICLECYDISKPFYEKMADLELQIDDIHDEMKFACKENRKNKLNKE